ncbi:methyl-CpG-binding domain-containing protein 6-like [Senna tora]|uniref:Methyl-CpG-binding domain-containing protein 6-like n=1 Tax=Senna tora TaxID=362788 RepID=A0A834XJX8_9FABA|nr:methyl-CpG-binding domain-containing protein 6-like [Senna tora]
MENNFVPSAEPTLDQQSCGMALQPHQVYTVLNKHQYDKIFEDLKRQVSNSIKDMKLKAKEEASGSDLLALAIVPISTVYNAMEGEDATPLTAKKRRGRKTTTELVGEINVSYEMPSICILDSIDLDKLPVSGEAEASDGSNNNKNKGGRKYSFAERLENWSLQHRKRSKGMHDVYYHHHKSSSSFRSIVEVVNFMMYETYPRRPTNKTKDEDASATPKRRQKRSGGGNGEDGGKTTKSKMDEAEVVKFFLESSQNLMNCNLYEPKDDVSGADFDLDLFLFQDPFPALYVLSSMANNFVPSAEPTWDLDEQLFENQLQQIFENLKQQVSQSVKDMNPNYIEEEAGSGQLALAVVPLTIVYAMEGDDYAPPIIARKRRGRRTVTYKLAGELVNVSYEIPPVCVLDGIDLDKFPVCGEEASDGNNNNNNGKSGRKCSFAERLENWSLQYWERSKGMHDIYHFHHERSSSSFCSILEVVNFIMYESYPPKSTNKINAENAIARPGKKMKMDEVVVKFFDEPEDVSEDEI